MRVSYFICIRHLLNIEFHTSQNVVMRQSKRSHSAPATLRSTSLEMLAVVRKHKTNSTKVTRRRGSACKSIQTF